ncbi:MAG: 3-keto-L-gulonate-6-phosphate decarboxylase UlaD [Desulfofustis sp.]|nr:3-keto-L-gulonate-6-phosphate decarboxylase UlaD [Desulfofustis sp.]NNK57551.1 3-keto-L-gulonate-6-phosphate decarboxylase UlaD [Desulfofustis sp.]
MSKPLLQVALDHLDIPSALEATRALADEVDVLEMGTILCYAEGSKAVGILRALYPEKTIVADLKAADAGGTVAEIVFSQGANWMTVICNAPYATMEAALEVARKYNGDLQIELYGDWTFDHARKWREIGLTQAIYHRGRDAGLAGQQWGEEDLEKIRKLADMGFEVSVTGGLYAKDLDIFAGIPVKCFIAGRGLYGADDPARSARDFKDAINKYW